MKRFTNLVLAAAFALSATVCSAQYSQQQFGLSTDLAGYLGLTTSQIDTINKNLLILNYDWSEAVNNTVLLDNQIEAKENDATQSPSAIGLATGSYIQQKVTIARAIIGEVTASNKALLAILTPAQQQKLAAIQSAVQNAYNILNVSGGAFYGNLFLSEYSVTGFDPSNSGMGYPTPPQPAVNAISEAFAGAVVQAHAETKSRRVVEARKAHRVPLESR